MSLTLRSGAARRWDLVSLGKVRLRLDPGERRIHPTGVFEAWEGGGDSFACGFIYSLMEWREPERALRCGVAHGALDMSTPGGIREGATWRFTVAGAESRGSATPQRRPPGGDDHAG